MKTTASFIQAVRDEKHGFKFDQPWRLGENSKLTVIPVLRTSKQRRKYITFAEAGDIESKDTGSIDYIYVKNNEDRPVFVARGDIFRGKTQERAAIHGHIIMPHKGLRVAVRCIHLTKGINANEGTHYGGRTPYDIDLSDQNRTWDSVATHNTCYYQNTTTSNIGIGTSSPKDNRQPNISNITLTGSIPFGDNIVMANNLTFSDGRQSSMK